MPSLIEKVNQSLRHSSVQHNDTLVVAVSGGPDSVCLLRLLKKLSAPFSFSLHVAHLNHQFRPDAGKDARFVAQLAADLGLPSTISKRPVLQICHERGLSKQAGARFVRYQFLHEVLKGLGAKWIVTGHTADDQAETFLMHVLRGSGIAGLRGIPEKRNDMIIRPLIHCTRDEIMEELSSNTVSYVEDPSNTQMTYLRNKVRHRLLPVLKQYNPNIRETLCRETILLQSENDFINQSMRKTLPSLGLETGDGFLSLDIAALQRLHVALQRRVLRWGIEQILHGLEGIEFKHIEAIRLQILKGQSGKGLELPHDLRIEKQYTKLLIKQVRQSTINSLFETHPKTCILPEIKDTSFSTDASFPEWGLRLKLSLVLKSPPIFSVSRASFDFDKISMPLSLRGWHPGDKFAPFGMGGRHKKLQDFFTDNKVPRATRHRIPLLICPEGILWLLGLRVDDRFRVTESTSRTLVVEIKFTE